MVVPCVLEKEIEKLLIFGQTVYEESMFEFFKISPMSVSLNFVGQRLTAFILITVLSCVVPSAVFADRDIKKAVVKIYTVFNKYDYYEPWQMQGQRMRNGSGCIINGKRIITNAHVVGDRTFIQVKRAGEAKKYTAEVEIVAHECDLALLKVNDDRFFAGVRPLDFGDLTEVRDKVSVYGFPKGGDELCITEGVVSRVEHRKYTHSNAYLLTCQIDAAINSGNSGGPVIKGNKIVGVAFQAGAGENIGYMVPVPVVKHFIKDIEDGKRDGIPGLGISWQEMENQDLRIRSGLNEKQSGILINKVYPDSAAMGTLESGDVILSIDGHNIENNGTIEFRAGERTFFGYLIQKKYINDMVKFGVMRDKEIIHKDIQLISNINFGRLVSHEQYDIPPTYYIIGGLVFEPLVANFLKTWGKRWINSAPGNLVNYYFTGEAQEDRRQIIVLVKVLADEINVGYHDWRHNVISRVNGKNISSINDLVKAFDAHKGPYHIIEDEWGYKIVLDKLKVDRNSKGILEKYKIISDRSKDLEALLQ